MFFHEIINTDFLEVIIHFSSISQQWRCNNKTAHFRTHIMTYLWSLYGCIEIVSGEQKHAVFCTLQKDCVVIKRVTFFIIFLSEKIFLNARIFVLCCRAHVLFSFRMFVFTYFFFKQGAIVYSVVYPNHVYNT